MKKYSENINTIPCLSQSTSKASIPANARNAPDAKTISIRIFVCALVGIAFGAVLLLPLKDFIRHYFFADPKNIIDYTQFNNYIWTIFKSSPYAFVIALIYTFPAVSLAVLVGMIFRCSIDKYLKTWSTTSPIIFCIYFLFINYLSSMTDTNIQATSMYDFVRSLFEEGKLLYLFSPAISALIFYRISLHRNTNDG